MELPLLLILSAALVTAGLTDFWHKRIPNLVTIPGMAVAVAFYGLSAGGSGALFGVSGLLLGAAAFMPMYLLGGMGAGDVKLMGMVGAFLGPTAVFSCLLYVFMVGGVYALAMLVRPSRGKGENREKPVLRYGLAIGLGTSLFLFFGWNVAG